jgi:hypothetical protein
MSSAGRVSEPTSSSPSTSTSHTGLLS